MTGVAIIGCGLAGTRRAQALPEDAELLAVYDPNMGAATNIAAAANIAMDEPGRVMICGSAEDAITRAELVIVATPIHDLAPLAVKAMKSGRHVLIEKPGGLYAEELEAIAFVANQVGVTARVGYTLRHHPAIAKARELIDGEAPLWMRAVYGHGGRPGLENEWRAQHGELMDQGVHLIDLALHLFGPACTAFVEETSDYWGCQENAYLALRPERGGMAWLHASWTEWHNTFRVEIATKTQRIEVQGLGGSYGPEEFRRWEAIPGKPTWPMIRSWPNPDAWRAELATMLDAIAGRPSVCATPEEAAAVLRVANR